MAEKKKIPEIRFKGFTEEWEERKLGALCLIGDIDHKMPPTVIDGIPYLMTGDFIGINDLDFENSKLISTEDYEQLSKKIKPEEGDILFARYASVGAVRYVETQLKFLVSYSCAIVKNADNANGKYLFYYLQANETKRQIELEINTGSQRNIGIDSLKKLNIHLPQKREQEEVAIFLTNLDHLITLHKRKYNKLVTVKKAMLEKMFPQKGALVPEIRFKRFTEEWEERKLGEVTDSYSGGTPSVGNDEYYGGEIPFIRSAEINSDSTELFITEKGLNNSSAKLVNIGHILYALYGATSGEVGRARIKGAINQAILAIIPKNDYDAEFIKQWLRKKKREIISTYLQGGQGNLSGTIVKDLNIDLPCYDEQSKIGNFFKHLDHLITLQQSELEKLKNIKKGCLERMFV